MSDFQKNSSKNIPTILVIFGATGDLSRKKLAPALFRLYSKGMLPERFHIVGFSRREYSDEVYREYLASVLEEYHGISKKDSAAFLQLFSFVQGDFTKKSNYSRLAEKLKAIDDSWGICTNKLFYLAVAPEFYKNIFSHLSSSGLTDPCSPEEGWTRVLVEKPFGKDEKTARSLDEFLARVFKEVQIYRIDHYLAKEMLQNILTFRFSNNLFEKNWSNQTIERIDIRVWEKIGVEERGVFYDGIGALRDVGQNHLLQMLALVTMDLPSDYSASSIRKVRADIVRKFKILSGPEIKKYTRHAQYDGYNTITGVDPHSKTETYFQINNVTIDDPRWSGVPILLESGKRLGEQRKEIIVTFRHSQPCLCPEGMGHYRNKVLFALEPEERITIHFWSKKPGLLLEMEERKFEFLLRDKGDKVQYVEEYEKLLLDCITGDQTLFVSTDEIRAMWQFIDPIIRGWKKNIVALEKYTPDSNEVTEKTVTESLTKKHIGFIGLGKMGMNMAVRLHEKGWHVTAFDINENARKSAQEKGMKIVTTLAEFKKFKKPQVLWLMIPAGKALDEVLFGKNGIVNILGSGDIIIDGGNSFFEDTIVRARKLQKKKVHFLDVGVSGGPDGARKGASLMIGGEREQYEKMVPLFADLAVEGGYAYIGKSGAGHFVKMIHNGIEYGMMQAIAEGFAVMKKSSFRPDLKNVVEVYNHGSVIESRLMQWLEKAFDEYGEKLDPISGSVAHTGEGLWTIKTAKKLKISIPVIEQALQFRIQSEKNPSYTGKILSALRNQFGGHDIKAKSK